MPLASGVVSTSTRNPGSIGISGELGYSIAFNRNATADKVDFDFNYTAVLKLQARPVCCTNL